MVDSGSACLEFGINHLGSSLSAGGVECEEVGPAALAEHERELAGRAQAVGMSGAKGRAGLFVLERAQHVLMEEAVLAPRLACIPHRCLSPLRGADAHPHLG